jgi:2'-5' RNA ligase
VKDNIALLRLPQLERQMSPILTSDTAGPLFPEAGGRGRPPGAPPARMFIRGPRPCPSDPVYLMLYTPKDAAQRMTQLGSRFCHRYELPGRPTEAGRAHVTVHPLCCFGRLTRIALAEIDNAISHLTMPPFVASFDLVKNFGRNGGPLVLCGDEGVIGLAMLRDEIVTAMRTIGFRAQQRDFTPHITLNYGRCVVPDQSIEDIRWVVRELVLVCSLYGRHQHLVLARWPLRSPSRFN